MIDVRENILVRLAEIASTMPGIKNTYRNWTRFDETNTPAINVLDGSEDTPDAGDASGHPSDKPIATTMTPQILVIKISPQVGPEINALRRELVKAILYDAQLNQQIVKTAGYGNGTIRYLGCQTDLGWAGSMFGALQVNLEIKYWLKPWQL